MPHHSMRNEVPPTSKNPGAEAPGLNSNFPAYWSACGGVSVLSVQVGLEPTVGSA